MIKMDSIFNKEKLIEYIAKVNVSYKKYRKRMDINVIEGQKWNVILGIS